MAATLEVVAEVLAMLRARDVELHDIELGAPFGILFDQPAKTGVHVVQEGACWVARGEHRIALAAGDVVVVPTAFQHALLDHPRTVPRSLRALRAAGVRPPARRPGEAGARMTCGSFTLERGHPVLDALPPLVHLRAAEVPSALRSTIVALRDEAASRGAGDAIAARLIEASVMIALRAWLPNASAPLLERFHALADPVVAPALAAVHRAPFDPWSVQRLAKLAHRSREAFSRRFVRATGESPGRYLARLRLDHAARMLRESDRPIAAIAVDVGYASEPAFHRAFRRAFGVAPGEHRRAD